MKLSVNVDNLLSRYPLEKAAEIYKSAGFDALDYPLFSLTKDDSPLSSDAYRDIAEDIRKTVESAGLVINQTHAPFDWHPHKYRDAQYFEDIIFPRFARSVELSAIMGADIVVMHPLHYHRYAGNEEMMFDINMKFFRRLIPVCREYGIKVGIENVWSLDMRRNTIMHDTCSQTEEFIKYIDTLDSEYMVACLDTGHIGLPAGQTEETADVIYALGTDRLKALHVHDNSYKADDHNLPFNGALNWAAITEALGKIGYNGDFTYEVNTSHMKGFDDDFVYVGTKYMADIGRHLIGRIDKARH